MTDNLIEIWGDSPTNIYVVGYNGVILHSAGGGTWTREDSGVTARLLGVGGLDGFVYVVGVGQQVLRSTGDGVWSAFPLDTPLQQLDSVVPDGRGGLLLSGMPGIILRGP